MGILNTLVFFIISVKLLSSGTGSGSGSFRPTSFRPRALALPVTKDASTNQYLTRLRQRTPFVPITLAIDLGSGNMWINCQSNFISSSYRPVSCARCQNITLNSACSTGCTGPQAPGCNNSICSGFPWNPFIRTTAGGDVGEDVVSFASIEGSHAGPPVIVQNFLFVCGYMNVQPGLAAGATGIIGLGRGLLLGPPLQLAATFSFPRRFAVCLPSSTSRRQPGLIVFGNTPFNVIPGLTVSNLLTYTPLYISPVSAAPPLTVGELVDYYIGLRSITIADHPIPINNTLLRIDRSGLGGTKISTVDPFTLLHPSIYRAFTTAFIREAQSRNISRVVPGIAPFDVCFRISKGSRLIPHINLELNGANRPIWTITGTNSMVQVNENISCLGFVEAPYWEVTSIVIGGRQIEDTLLEFDIARSRLGFSYSLVGHGTTCSNHNFTATY